MSSIKENREQDQDFIRKTILRKSRKEKGFPEFEKFILQYEGIAREIAGRILKNHCLVEQALQEAKLKMFEVGLKEEFTESPFAYYRRVIKTTCIDLSKYEQHRRHEPMEVSGEDDRPTRQYPAGPDSRPDVLFEAVNRRKNIEDALGEAFNRILKKAPGKIRALDVLRMRFFEDLDLGEIAKRMGMERPNSISQIIRRGLEDLRKILEEMGIEGFPGIDLVLDEAGK